ncbi:MAG TPA: PEP-CTERM sorting domain-containing protein [Bryobacteraceae bacterium]|nr:PEP-CTERM sorting domain-containing protein [Bryobacteraceae bacterium]
MLNLTTWISGAGFILYSFDVTASSSATPLQFNDRARHSFFYLDDIQVDDLHTSSVLTPEPASLVLLAAGLLSLIAAKKYAID